ncbi:MAG: succinate dehydrogenase assembly factor 2 [Thiomicrospira sp.]|jgi:succinate dehydrogenase flavin-adding protein (antitoxin of CptAB toxin-antitoxin module)|nr:succinate dehydrogenase assembly factor 2 [Thiomicrospira sp.]
MTPPLKNQQAWLNPLRWQARRGVLEAEILLAPFIDSLALSVDKPPFFATLCELLNESDENLERWLLRPQQAPANYQALIQTIRKNYLNSKA